MGCSSLKDDSVLIDLVDFAHLEYDEASATATASPSTTGGQLLDALAPSKRFVPVGHCGGIGLGGFFLQGGMGLNSRVISVAELTGFYIFIQLLADFFDRATDGAVNISPDSM